MMSLASLAAVAAAAPAEAAAQSTPRPAKTAASVEADLIARALQNVHPMDFDGHAFSGPGWDLLLAEGRTSEFVLFGEEHGMVQTPVLARALFLALRPAGFDTLAIEISPPIAQDLDAAARGGLEGIAAFARRYPPGPAFYFWKSEAELIAAVRAAVPGRQDALWGLDYEVTGDRRLIERLQTKAPGPAKAALTALDEASQAAWATWARTHNPGVLFTFSGDPKLVRAVREAWPRRDADVSLILDTLEQTLEINGLFPAKIWESNELRTRFMRANFVAHLDRATSQGRRPKAMVKMGESHTMRGVSWTGNFDIGSLVPEAAALRGGKAFSTLVGGGRNARHGVLNPSNMSVADAPVDMFRQLGLQFLVDAIPGDGPQLVDVRPLRGLLNSTSSLKALNNPEAVRTIFATETMIVWHGSTATQMLVKA
jgi:erythromycin esterase-like protein